MHQLYFFTQLLYLSLQTAHLAESVIFIYLGLTIFTQHDERFRWALVLFVFLFILVGRAASVFPLAYAINFVGDAQRMGFRERLRMGVLWPTRESISLDALTAPSDAWIPPSHQVMLWWAGLRGAIAFALSMDIQTPSAPELRTTTLYY